MRFRPHIGVATLLLLAGPSFGQMMQWNRKAIIYDGSKSKEVCGLSIESAVQPGPGESIYLGLKNGNNQRTRYRLRLQLRNDSTLQNGTVQGSIRPDATSVVVSTPFRGSLVGTTLHVTQLSCR